MIEVTEIKKTPLWTCHAELGAKFTPFAGWDMPVMYSGVIAEHQTVRSAVGLFDVSHMGEIVVTGSNAKSYLQYVTSNDVGLLVSEKARYKKAQYGFLLNESGGVVDDIITYCFSDTHYLICVNASNVTKDFLWLLKNKIDGVDVRNASDEYAQLALQGPLAERVLSLLDLRDSLGDVCNLGLAELPAFTFMELDWNLEGNPNRIIVARTGYTGEDGFELFCKPELASHIWNALLECGSSFGIKPIGLGARDTLRLEAKLPLYGHELSDDTSALASGFGWAIKLDKGEFIGRDALLPLRNSQSTSSEKRDVKLVGFQVLDKGIVRGEAKLFVQNSSGLERLEIGHVTSGTYSPTLGKALGLAYVDSLYTKIGTRLMADVRGKLLEVEICKTPFYRRKA